MAHLKHSENRASNTPPEWLAVGRAIGELANKWSERHDLVGYVGTNAGHGAPACYNPQLAEIEVDTAIAFGKMISPEQVGDLTQRATQFEFAKATGAIMHEALHAKFSQWDLEKAYKDLEKDEHQALILLEESRIEAQGLLAMPESLNFLRACAMDIVIADAQEKFETASNTQSAAFLVATVHARIDAGILDESEVKDLVELVDGYMTPEVIAKLRAVAAKFQAHTMHANAELLYPLAKEWAQIIREVAEEKGDAQGEDGKPESGEGGEGSSGMSKEFAKMLMDALEEAGEVIAIGNADALADQEQAEDWKQEVEDKQADAKDRQKNQETAKQVFEKSTGVGVARTSSRLRETRKPTSQERVAAVQIAQMLEKAKYRERDAVEIASITPPGRLRTRQMVQGKALKERGVMQQVEPFRRTVRKHTEDPTLTVGVMVDISGSMGSAMNPMATTAWVMSEAVRRVQGKCAMVYYGNDVFATLKSGQHLEEVNVYTAEDGTEKFDKAFRALDGSLDLLNGSGARLLVVVSDGQYTHEEREFAKKWITRCNQAGVAILWLPFDGGHYAERLTRHGKAAVLSGVLDPTGAASEIGRAAAGELTNVGRLNA
jgi:hypothetical protein